MGKTFKRVWNILTSVIVVLAILLAVALVGVRLVGLEALIVLSGSMEPTYHTGSILYVRDVDCAKLKVNDVITFVVDDEGTLATHRIVEIVPDKEDSSVLRFRTKGDANDNRDGGLVHYKNVKGKPVFSIPKLGYFANYIQKPPGLYVAISVGALLLLLFFLPDIFGDGGKGKKGKKSAADASEQPPEQNPEAPAE